MKAPGLALIIAQHMKKKSPVKEDDSSSEELMPSEDEGKQSEMELSAAQDLLDAVKAGDAEALRLALKDFVELCGGYGGSPSDEE